MGGLFPLAFSVHKFISSVGADAGFAAIIGLAILVLLFFAQARETSSLRNHAEELIARIGELEARLARLSQQQAQAASAAANAQVPAAPQVQQAGVRAVAAGAGSASIRLASLEIAPFPPAFVGAPALTAATRLVPAGVAARAAAARVPVPVGAGGGAAPPEAPPESGPAPVAAPSPTVTAPVAAPVAGPGPATAAGATNGASHTRAAPVPYRAGGAGGASGQRPTMPPRGGGTPAAGPRRPPARPGTTALPDHLAIKPERSRWGRIGLGLLVLAVAAGAVAAVLVLTHHSSPSSSASRSSTTSGKTAKAGRSTRTTRGAVLVNPATVTVSVLNGTTTNGLAGRTLSRLQADGFKPGIKTTATDQTHATSVVYYLPGHQAAATAVAQKLGLATRAVQAIDPATRNVAFYSSCAAPPCVAEVVVLLGADLANR